MDILDGVETVGIWPGQSREYRRDDWEVGFRDRHGGHHKLVRVRNADRDKAYAYYLWLSEGDNDNWSLYVKRHDGANWWRGCCVMPRLTSYSINTSSRTALVRCELLGG
jgi:hypothetical protein